MAKEMKARKLVAYLTKVQKHCFPVGALIRKQKIEMEQRIERKYSEYNLRRVEKKFAGEKVENACHRSSLVNIVEKIVALQKNVGFAIKAAAVSAPQNVLQVPE